MTTQTLTQESLLDRARSSLNSDECMSVYDKWASTYNDDLAENAQDYVAPALVAQIALKSSSDPTSKLILDAGCGTGLVGQALALGGVRAIDGLDLSPAMLKVAKQTRVYQQLFEADLNRQIVEPDRKYDIVTCVGTFTHGHVGPVPALQEFVRITKKHGIIVATVIETIWRPGGFQAEVERLKASGLVKVVAMELIDYVKGHGDKAVLIILEKSGNT